MRSSPQRGGASVPCRYDSLPEGGASPVRVTGRCPNARWLRLRSQRRLRKRVEQLDRRAGDAEDLTTATAQCDPGFECRDALGPKPIDERLRQIIWQSMRHARKFWRFVAVAKQNLTLMQGEFSIQRWVSQNGGRPALAARPARPSSRLFIPEQPGKDPRGQRTSRRFPLRCCSSAPRRAPAPAARARPYRCVSRLHR